MTLKEEAKRIEEYLINTYRKWKDVYENGCNDPFYEDGINLALMRNHIIYYKNKCENVLKDNFLLYPDVYFFPLPENVPYEYMAKDRKLVVKPEVSKCSKTKPYSDMLVFKWEEVFKEML